jgi:tRNA-Thr(GGU) m(6)t(6)A37 methyltransferase TsaA
MSSNLTDDPKQMLSPLKAIGRAHTCFPEKFGIPRQSGIVKELLAELEFFPPYDDPRAFQDVSLHSHFWLLWLFHEVPEQVWKPRVKPPRLGGNRESGVFATRSPFRPNRIGLSLVRLERIKEGDRSVRLLVSGGDLLDQTPIVDLKPYIPWADCAQGAARPYEWPVSALTAVTFSDDAKKQLDALAGQRSDQLAELFRALLLQDPRPAYRSAAPDPNRYGLKLYEFEAHWRVIETGIAQIFEVIRW